MAKYFQFQVRPSADADFKFVGSVAQEHWAATADSGKVMAQANAEAGFEQYRSVLVEV